MLGEAAAVLCVEDEMSAKARGAPIYARIRGVSGFFDGFKIGKIHPEGKGLERAVSQSLDMSGIGPGEIDYISSCANSSLDMDRIEVKVLRKLFGKQLEKIPVSAIKSMLGETCSASGNLQIASCIGAMRHNFVPPTINYRDKDPDCDIDCVPNKAQEKEVKLALITSFGPGGYNSAAVIEKYID